MRNKILYGILFLLIISAAIGLLYINKRDIIAIIGAMDVEVEEILTNLSNTKNVQHADFRVITGNLGKYKILLSKSGIGKVNAATTTQFLKSKA